jgi:hypothetical protein
VATVEVNATSNLSWLRGILMRTSSYRFLILIVKEHEPRVIALSCSLHRFNQIIRFCYRGRGGSSLGKINTAIEAAGVAANAVSAGATVAVPSREMDG